mmetsp:Transcript_10499/g.23620  ORF Transcript_10499/g.23620 Transcript_10499/m.23620 type:complete len:269 (-) Transcript_10499:9-815(-)
MALSGWPMEAHLAQPLWRPSEGSASPRYSRRPSTSLMVPPRLQCRLRVSVAALEGAIIGTCCAVRGRGSGGGRCRRASRHAQSDKDEQWILDIFSSLFPGSQKPVKRDEDDQARWIVAGLQQHARKLEQGARESAAQLQSVRSALTALTKYAESLEDENDTLRADNESLRAERNALMREIAREAVMLDPVVELPRRVLGHGKADAAKAAGALPLPSSMNELELQQECMQRGINTDGSLAVLRARIRAARSREKRGAEDPPRQRAVRAD